MKSYFPFYFYIIFFSFNSISMNIGHILSSNNNLIEEKRPYSILLSSAYLGYQQNPDIKTILTCSTLIATEYIWQNYYPDSYHITEFIQLSLGGFITGYVLKPILRNINIQNLFVQTEPPPTLAARHTAQFTSLPLALCKYTKHVKQRKPKLRCP